MRTVIALHDWNGGGTERVAMALAGVWIAAGDEVSVVIGHDAGPARSWAPAGLNIVELPMPIRRSPASRLMLGRAMRPVVAALAPDAVLLPGNFHLFLGRSLARLRNRPRIVSKLSNPLWPYSAGAALAGPLVRAWMTGADAFAAMNTGLAADARRVLGGARVEVIEDPLLVPVAERAAPPEADRFVMIGRLEAQKDTALGLRAMAALRRLRPDARLEVVGDGPERSGLVRLAAELGVPVRWRGREPDVCAALDGAAALLVTSRYEGGPAVAIEALARGVPVVATDCSALLRDVLTVPEAGTIVATRTPEALATALAAQTLRPDPARLRVLERFRPEVSARRYRALLLGD